MPSSHLGKVYELAHHCNLPQHFDLSWRFLFDNSDKVENLCRKVLGHYGFYGITFNIRSLNRFYEQIKRVWRKWLNRRSRDKHMPWERFDRLLGRYPLPRPRIVHKFA
jgi:hypothetical protein